MYFQGGKIHSIDFHRKDDLLVMASEDDSVRLYDIANAKWVYFSEKETNLCFKTLICNRVVSDNRGNWLAFNFLNIESSWLRSLLMSCFSISSMFGNVFKRNGRMSNSNTLPVAFPLCIYPITDIDADPDMNFIGLNLCLLMVKVKCIICFCCFLLPNGGDFNLLLSIYYKLSNAALASSVMH